MKAKLLSTLRLNGKSVRPQEGEVILVDLDQEEFARLESFGAVEKPTANELKIGILKTAVTEPVVVDTNNDPKSEQEVQADATKNAASGRKPTGGKKQTETETGNDTVAGGTGGPAGETIEGGAGDGSDLGI